MRHGVFVALLAAALCLACLPWFVMAMNECQLHQDPALAAACFRNNHRGMLMYEGTLIAGLVMSIGLHFARSRWILIALAFLAVGPWVLPLV